MSPAPTARPLVCDLPGPSSSRVARTRLDDGGVATAMAVFVGPAVSASSDGALDHQVLGTNSGTASTPDGVPGNATRRQRNEYAGV